MAMSVYIALSADASSSRTPAIDPHMVAKSFALVTRLSKRQRKLDGGKLH
jgi:hypothetical protein